MGRRGDRDPAEGAHPLTSAGEPPGGNRARARGCISHSAAHQRRSAPASPGTATSDPSGPTAGTVKAVSSRLPRIVLTLVGVIALVIGLVFAGQGAGLIAGSFMTGSRQWLTIGFIVAVVGVILLWLGLRRRGSRPRA